jgi:uncharacterized protein (DUF697 family)
VDGLNLDKAFSIAAALVGVALVTTVVAHKNSAKVIKAIGSSFSGAIRASIGR